MENLGKPRFSILFMGVKKMRSGTIKSKILSLMTASVLSLSILLLPQGAVKADISDISKEDASAIGTAVMGIIGGEAISDSVKYRVATYGSGISAKCSPKGDYSKNPTVNEQYKITCIAVYDPSTYLVLPPSVTFSGTPTKSGKITETKMMIAYEWSGGKHPYWRKIPPIAVQLSLNAYEGATSLAAGSFDSFNAMGYDTTDNTGFGYEYSNSDVLPTDSVYQNVYGLGGQESSDYSNILGDSISDKYDINGSVINNDSEGIISDMIRDNSMNKRDILDLFPSAPMSSSDSANLNLDISNAIGKDTAKISDIGEFVNPASVSGSDSGTNMGEGKDGVSNSDKDTGNSSNTDGADSGNAEGTSSDVFGRDDDTFQANSNDWADAVGASNGTSDLDGYFDEVSGSAGGNLDSGFTDNLFGLDSEENTAPFVFGNEDSDKEYYAGSMELNQGEWEDENGYIHDSNGNIVGHVNDRMQEMEDEEFDNFPLLDRIGQYLQDTIGFFDNSVDPNSKASRSLSGSGTGVSLKDRIASFFGFNERGSTVSDQEMADYAMDFLSKLGYSKADVQAGRNYDPKSAYTEPSRSWDMNRITTLLNGRKINIKSINPKTEGGK